MYGTMNINAYRLQSPVNKHEWRKLIKEPPSLMMRNLSMSIAAFTKGYNAIVAWHLDSVYSYLLTKKAVEEPKCILVPTLQKIVQDSI
jgi:hypothetical protein